MLQEPICTQYLLMVNPSPSWRTNRPQWPTSTMILSWRTARLWSCPCPIWIWERGHRLILLVVHQIDKNKDGILALIDLQFIKPEELRSDIMFHLKQTYDSRSFRLQALHQKSKDNWLVQVLGLTEDKLESFLFQHLQPHGSCHQQKLWHLKILLVGPHIVSPKSSQYCWWQLEKHNIHSKNYLIGIWLLGCLIFYFNNFYLHTSSEKFETCTIFLI